jgi:signal transduction histidine kinase
MNRPEPLTQPNNSKHRDPFPLVPFQSHPFQRKKGRVHGWLPGLAFVLVVCIGGFATQWLTEKWEAAAHEDDTRRFNAGMGGRENRFRDRLSLYGSSLQQLGLAYSWSGGNLIALSNQFRTLRTEGRLASITEWGVLDSRSLDASKPPMSVSVDVAMRPSSQTETGSAFQESPKTELDPRECLRAIRLLRPNREISIALERMDGRPPRFRVLCKVPKTLEVPTADSTRFVYGIVPVDELWSEIFGTEERGVLVALYRGNTNRPAEISKETPLFFGTPAPVDPVPAVRRVMARPLFGLPVFWEIYTTPLFENRGAPKRIRALRIAGWGFSSLTALTVGFLVWSRNWHIRNEQRLEAANQDLTAERETRLWLTRNLHDGLVQDLHGAALFLGSSTPGSEESGSGTSNGLHHVRQLLRDAELEIRNFIQLTSGHLPSGKDLPQLLREMGERMADRGETTVETQVSGESLEAVPERIQFEFWLAAREALSNVAKHAQATHVRLQLNVTQDRIELEVQDDGVGISVNLVPKPGSWGIRNLQDRSLALGGTLELSGSPGAGTRLRLTAPYRPTSRRE